MKEFLFVFLGGGLGTTLRYLTSLFFSAREPALHFPWSTFTVNIIGSLLIGAFYVLSSRLSFSAEVRLFLTVGLCGGFTTFSTFSYEGVQLLKTELYGTFLLYTGSSILFGLLAVLSGAYLTHKLHL